MFVVPDSEEAASKIHELVWNQDVVPFLLVHFPLGVRLYSGFRCQPQHDGLERGVLKTLTRFNEFYTVGGGISCRCYRQRQVVARLGSRSHAGNASRF